MAYEFTVEDFNKFTNDIVGANGDQAQISTLLADMQSTLVEAVGMNTKLQGDNEQMKAENERLKNANMDLMYRLGEKAVNDTNQKKQEKEELPRGENVNNYLDNLFKEDK